MAQNNNATRLSYDKIKRKTVDGETVNYGIVFGNEKIVFIKSGAEGSVRGYKDKYLKMAYKIHERMGATVICATNPLIACGHDTADKEMISKTASEMNYSEYELYFVGTSDGAYHNLVLAKQMPQTVKVLGISTSRKTIQDLKEKLCDLAHVKKILVYGTKDYESDVLPTLKNFKCDNLEIKTVEGADHEFHGMLDEYIALIDLL